MLIEEPVDEIEIKDRDYFFNVLNTEHPYTVTKQVTAQRLKRKERT